MKFFLLALLLLLLACAPDQDPLDPTTPTPEAPPPAYAEGAPERGAPSPPSGATEDNTAASRDMVPRLFPTGVHVVPKKMGVDAPALLVSDAQQATMGVVWQTPMPQEGTLVVGIYPDGTVVGVEVMGTGEKPLEDATFLAQFTGKTPDELARPEDLKPADGAEASSRVVWDAVRVAVDRMLEIL